MNNDRDRAPIEIPSDSRPSRFGDRISIALTIHSLDPLQTSGAQLRKINRQGTIKQTKY